ncbi:MAG: EutN/CcmL family microcompartment protein [Planctomycetota bacterium]|jgi:ethanolamine utilization protein EutN
MQVALVLGNAISTVKHRSLENVKLLVCQPLASDGKSRDGSPVIAADYMGAGAGERVILTSDGSAVRELYGLQNSPLRWTVMGLIDDLQTPAIKPPKREGKR